MNETLNELRPRMMSVAYRMLGCVADAEDAVQDAYVRLLIAGEVASPEGFLVRATTHRCIDRLRANRRREKHLRRWSRNPEDSPGPPHSEAPREPLRKAFLFLLERLTPPEIVAYLLRTAFHCGHTEIAEILGKSTAHVRQIFCRADFRVLYGASRFAPTPLEAESLAERFVAACRSGQPRSLGALFVDDTESGPRILRRRPPCVPMISSPSPIPTDGRRSSPMSPAPSTRWS